MTPPGALYPRQLTLIRHAESAGNVANDAALRSGLPELDLALRDMDVPLSSLGEAQADALGTWFATRPAPPDVVLCSPYRRALDTGARALAASGLDVPVRCDERLREREFGVLDRLTKVGIEQRFPEQAAARAFIGKFFHRPPGGESWSDVAARVRGVVTDLRLDFPDADVVIVTHQAVIMLFRYVLDRLGEAELLELDASEQIANTSATTYQSDGDGMKLVAFNDTSHLPVEATTDAADRSPVPR